MPNYFMEGSIHEFKNVHFKLEALYIACATYLTFA